MLVSNPAFSNLDPSLLTLTFVKSDQMMHQALKTTDVNTFKVEEGFVKTGEVITKAGEVGKDMLDLGMFNVQNSAKAPSDTRIQNYSVHKGRDGGKTKILLLDELVPSKAWFWR